MPSWRDVAGVTSSHGVISVVTDPKGIFILSRNWTQNGYVGRILLQTKVVSVSSDDLV